jgi:hypothetical protein
MELGNLGDELFTNGMTVDALAVLKRNAEEFSDLPYTYFLLSRVYMMKDDYPAAKIITEKVLRTCPDAEPAKQMLKMIDKKNGGGCREKMSMENLSLITQIIADFCVCPCNI